MLEGLKMAVDLHITQLLIELDARVVIDMVSNDYYSNSLLKPLVLECRNLIKRITYSYLRHVYREANFSADCLAKKGQQLQSPLSFFCSPPMDMIPFLRNDVSFVMYPRIFPRDSIT